MTVSVIMYKRLGISNADIALYTAWLYLPWVVKPLWGPVVELFKTKRYWIVVLQLVVGVCLASVAMTIPLPSFFRATLAIFWLMAFASATHDISADGFYMLALDHHTQAAFVGVRSTFYRLAMIAGQGALVVFAGTLEESDAGEAFFQWMNGVLRTLTGLEFPAAGRISIAWSLTFGTLAMLFIVFFLYHRVMLPRSAEDRPAPATNGRNPLQAYLAIFTGFFARREIWSIIAFLLLYRFAEAQLVKMVTPFLLDPRDSGGLGLTTSEVGIVYGTVGIIALTLGGLLGGFVVSRQGLKFWLWPMVVIIHLPDLAFVYLSQVQPESFLLINAAVAIEQFGYGFGFTAYILYMMLVSEGEHKTAHYAICTGIMALGMMIPGMFSGMLQELWGYKMFFLWIILSTFPGFIVASLVKIDPAFGKKTAKENA
jgi:PAT family beta-lactamase induction signal transducer AmpG